MDERAGCEERDISVLGAWGSLLGGAEPWWLNTALVVAGRWCVLRAAAHRESEHTRRVLAAVADTESRHLAEVVRACASLTPTGPGPSTRRQGRRRGGARSSAEP